jgi:hypothetical protein
MTKNIYNASSKIIGEIDFNKDSILIRVNNKP